MYSNRQKLHGLVIGEEGVRYHQEVQELTEKIAGLQKEVRKKERAIPASALGNFEIDDFCGLGLPNDLDDQLSATKKHLAVLRDAERIKQMEGFEALALPDLGTEGIKTALQATLPDLEATALDAVVSHFQELHSSRAEAWISEGMELATEHSACPYCGQDIAASPLLIHYQAYFSKAYVDHKDRIASAKNGLLERLGGDRLARFQRRVQVSKDRHEFWSRYLDVPAFNVDADELAKCWAAARDALVRAIDRKAAAPLERQDIDAAATEAVESYNDLAERMLTTSTALLEQADAIALAKEQASHGSLSAAEAQVDLLEAMKRRHEEETAAKCSKYLHARHEKDAAEAEKIGVRVALDKHRKKVFGNYQTSINNFLLKFNADFRIDDLAALDPKGIPSSSYELVVNKGRVGLSAARLPEPSFGTTLSSGDRTTLALAFFFATLKARPSLDSSIIVLDDPASSLDEGRALATAQEIRWLLGRAAQVIVLSHSRGLLGQLWEKADKENTSTIQFRDVGEEASGFETWNAEAAALTHFDLLHKIVREYSATSTGDPEKVATALRVVLEGFLRVAFAEHFPPGKMLKDFFSRANQMKNSGSPIMSDDDLAELDNLREYSNQFHHDESKTWQENLSNVNETQLKGYAKRVVQFTRVRYTS